MLNISTQLLVALNRKDCFVNPKKLTSVLNNFQSLISWLSFHLDKFISLFRNLCLSLDYNLTKCKSFPETQFAYDYFNLCWLDSALSGQGFWLLKLWDYKSLEIKWIKLHRLTKIVVLVPVTKYNHFVMFISLLLYSLK